MQPFQIKDFGPLTLHENESCFFGDAKLFIVIKHELCAHHCEGLKVVLCPKAVKQGLLGVIHECQYAQLAESVDCVHML